MGSNIVVLPSQLFVETTQIKARSQPCAYSIRWTGCKIDANRIMPRVPDCLPSDRFVDLANDL
jgi:hypothetical protein